MQITGKVSFISFNLQKKSNRRVYHLSEIFPTLNVSSSVMEIFGELKASLEKSGNIIDDMDLLIASTALTHNLVLVTNNEKHFNRISGLETENWLV